jgi:hypothetical protein
MAEVLFVQIQRCRQQTSRSFFNLQQRFLDPALMTARTFAGFMQLLFVEHKITFTTLGWRDMQLIL